MARREVEEKVLDVVRGLATEAGGDRAVQAVSLLASFDKDVGLGSLERAELLVRLESAFGRPFDDDLLEAETPADLVNRILDSKEDSKVAPGAEQRFVDEARELTSEPPTLTRVLAARAEENPLRPHVFLQREDGSEEILTYGRLYEEARTIAGGLREKGVRRGDTVALMLPTGTDFLRTFQGILLAGAIPVPLYPPARLAGLQEYLARQSAILRDCSARLLVVDPAVRPIARLLEGVHDAVTADDLVARPIEEDSGDGSTSALIQYTSGSTGRPKGVLLTHGNLLSNIRAIAQGLEARPTDVGVSWLPLYHDMGLIGSWLFCLVRGYPITLLSPLAFLTRPERWLWAIHRHRATLSGAPNFAYELCVRRIPDAILEGLDLSCWRCALNGAEPVSPDTLERFTKRFAAWGFDERSLLPVYGLAENSVALCFPPLGRSPKVDLVERDPFQEEGIAASATNPHPLRFVSCGLPLPDHEVRVLDEGGAVRPERHVGRLIFRGPSMTQGYYRNAEATAAMTVDGGWLDSGDLAYMAGGEVFVTGRSKDLIIKAGRNLVPQEIEEIVSSVEGIRKGCVVALGVPHELQGTESLVILAETRERDREALARAVRERVLDSLEMAPDEVRLLDPGSIPKTPSGKLRRRQTLELYRSGALGRAPREPLGARLRVLLSFAYGWVRRPVVLVARSIYAVYLFLVIALLAAFVWPIAMVLPGGKRLHALARSASRLVLRLGGLRLEVSGLEHLRGESRLIASNHASYIDVLVLQALLPLNFLFVAKWETLAWPVVGTFVRRLGHLTVDRANSGRSLAAAAAVEQATRGGQSVLVFPEGTFTRATGLRPFRLGVFKTAVETGIPVVPMALRGTRNALREGSLVPRPGKVSLLVGPPMLAEGKGWSSAVALRDKVQGWIASHCGEPLLQMVAGGAP